MLLVLLRTSLLNRRHRILLNGKSSEWKLVSSRVPQGSVLGSLFFLVSVYYLIENFHSDIKLFADDTSFCFVLKSEEESAE